MTYTPTDEQAEELWAVTGVVDRPEHRRSTDAVLGHAVAGSPAFQAIIRAAMAQAWAERDRARPSYLGPDRGHYEGCCGWEDCFCGSYLNPYVDWQEG